MYIQIQHRYLDPDTYYMQRKCTLKTEGAHRSAAPTPLETGIS